ncbi:MAG TPA: hypothetical protein VFA71_11135 [Terriglobales bacterium]|nr:hypothetical protein [Terriglobales bacterium]
MHRLYALLCLLGGSAVVWCGYRILRPYRRSEGATGFVGDVVSRPMLIGCAGQLLVIVGLIIAVVFTLIFLLT